MRSTRSPLGRVKAWYSRSSMGLFTTSAATAAVDEAAAREALGMGLAASESKRVLSPACTVDWKWCCRLIGADFSHHLPFGTKPPQQLRRSIMLAMSTRDRRMERAAARRELVSVGWLAGTGRRDSVLMMAKKK